MNRRCGLMPSRARGFDRDRYPAWRDWAAAAMPHARRAAARERLRQAGVMDLPDAEMGW
jgi:hypothetical protein